jgi:hypothetical protein
MYLNKSVGNKYTRIVSNGLAVENQSLQVVRQLDSANTSHMVFRNPCCWKNTQSDEWTTSPAYSASHSEVHLDEMKGIVEATNAISSS